MRTSGAVDPVARRCVAGRSCHLWIISTLLLAVAGLLAVYPQLNHGPNRWFLRTPVDERIPLVKPLVIPYLSIYAVAVLTLVVLLLRSVRLAESALLAAVFTLATAMVFYHFAQTYVARPQVTGDDLFSRLLRGVYSSDSAYNDFPSLHAGLSTVLAVHWVRLNRRLGLGVAAWCALIAVSTVFVHQHYLADVGAGVGVAAAACMAGKLISNRLAGPAADPIVQAGLTSD